MCINNIIYFSGPVKNEFLTVSRDVKNLERAVFEGCIPSAVKTSPLEREAMRHIFSCEQLSVSVFLM
jgi:hypothetical protein